MGGLLPAQFNNISQLPTEVQSNREEPLWLPQTQSNCQPIRWIWEEYNPVQNAYDTLRVVDYEYFPNDSIIATLYALDSNNNLSLTSIHYSRLDAQGFPLYRETYGWLPNQSWGLVGRLRRQFNAQGDMILYSTEEYRDTAQGLVPEFTLRYGYQYDAQNRKIAAYDTSYTNTIVSNMPYLDTTVTGFLYTYNNQNEWDTVYNLYTTNFGQALDTIAVGVYGPWIDFSKLQYEQFDYWIYPQDTHPILRTRFQYYQPVGSYEQYSIVVRPQSMDTSWYYRYEVDSLGKRVYLGTSDSYQEWDNFYTTDGCLSSVEGLRGDKNGPYSFDRETYLYEAPLSRSTPQSPLFTIYPNPSQGRFRVQSELADDWTVRVMDLRGRVIYQDQFEGMESPPIELPVSTGVFLVQIQSEQRISTRRLLLE